MRLTQGASEDTRKYMADGIRYVCEHFTQRAPGTHSERKAQKYFASELEKWSDSVETEDFDVHPTAFLGWIPIAGIINVLSVIFYWLTYKGVVNNSSLAFLSVILVFFVAACLIIEYIMCHKFVDFLFPRKISRNVIARKKPCGDAKRRIVFVGHTDASNEWTYSLHGGLKANVFVLSGSIGGLVIITIVNVIMLFFSFSDTPYSSDFWLIAGVVQLMFIPFFIAVMFIVNWKVVVDGANDNLSGNYIAMGVLSEMAKNNERFEHTEVCVLLCGSKEAGLRGADAFAKYHQYELREVETVFIVMDTMREISKMKIYTSGCKGMQKNSNTVGELIYQSGMNCGIEMPEAGIYLGEIDAEAFSRNGFEAAGLCGASHNPKSYYHTRLDTPDNMSEECINLSLDICIEAAKLYDENGGLHAFREEGKKRFKRGHN